MPIFALPGLALAVVLFTAQPHDARPATLALLADLFACLLPWRVPRSGRGMLTYWLEQLCYLVPMSLLFVYGLVHHAAWATRLPDPRWLGVGAAVGAGLVLLSGIDLGAVRSGDLAFLAGTGPVNHAFARFTAGTVAPLTEEALFRGAAIGLPAVNWPVALLAAAAFVARHHLLRGMAARMTREVITVEIAGAGSLLALCAISGSIYPSVLAHFINNLPMSVVNLQQARMGLDHEPA